MNPEQALNFTGKQVLVVGGSSGIGNGIAHAFRGLGADVSVWGTRASRESYSAADGSDLTGLSYRRVDVSVDAEIVAAARDMDRIDVLVTAQGAVKYKRQEFEIATFRQVVDVNLNSVMACCAEFHPKLKESAGSVIIIGSIGAFKSVKGNPAYAASKSAVHALARTLGDAWGSDGVRVNAIAPGMVATKMTEVTTGNPKRLEAALETISLGRLGNPADIAGPALFLASPLSAYITGQTIIVDGGRIL